MIIRNMSLIVNTYGLIPGTTRRYDRETRWTGILAEKLYDNGYRIIEEGLCGSTFAPFLPSLVASSNTLVLPHNPSSIIRYPLS